MNIVCPSCFATNKIPEDKSHLAAKCGKCQHDVHTFEPVNLTDGNFDAYIDRNDMPVLVDFWATWCGPCKMIAPIYKKIAAQTETVLFAKVNTEQARATATDYNIRSIPTFVMFYKGREIDRVSGGLPEHQLKAWILQTMQKI